MTDRAFVLETVQVGPEVTPGTEVDADFRLSTTKIVPSIQTENQEYMGSGYVFNTAVVNSKLWTQAAVSGPLSFTDPVYLLQAMFGAPTTAVDTGGTNAYQHEWIPEPAASDDPTTLTVEYGSSVRAALFTHGLLREFGFDISFSGATISGAMIGQELQDNITMTATPTVVAERPVSPKMVSVYLDTTSGNLGTTKLSRMMSARYSFPSKFSVFWPVDAANASFGGFAPIAAPPTLELSLGADAVGMSPLGYVQNGDTVFCRIEAIGPVIDVGFTTYRMTVDMALKVLSGAEFGESDGLTVIPWTFSNVYDPTWDNACIIQFVNEITSI